MASSNDGVKALLKEWSEAIRRKDIDGLMPFYAADAVYFDLVPPLRIVGADAIRRNFLRWFDGWTSAIGQEARAQILHAVGRLPDVIVACVGGGSNALGIFDAFIEDAGVRLVGVEAGGRSLAPGNHAARLAGGRVGVLHGTRSLVLQDEDGNILPTHSISAGLDYPSIGPEHAWLAATGRSEYVWIDDAQALAGFQWLAQFEGILPALESSHAVEWARQQLSQLAPGTVMLVNLSGRGDKDVEAIRRILGAVPAVVGLGGDDAGVDR